MVLFDYKNDLFQKTKDAIIPKPRWDVQDS